MELSWDVTTFKVSPGRSSRVVLFGFSVTGREDWEECPYVGCEFPVFRYYFLMFTPSIPSSLFVTLHVWGEYIIKTAFSRFNCHTFYPVEI